MFFVACTATVRAGVVSVCASASELFAVGEVVAVGAGREKCFDDFTRVPAPLHRLQQLLVRDHLLQQLLEIRPGHFTPDRNPHDAASTTRLIRYSSSSRSSLM